MHSGYGQVKLKILVILYSLLKLNHFTIIIKIDNFLGIWAILLIKFWNVQLCAKLTTM